MWFYGKRPRLNIRESGFQSQVNPLLTMGLEQAIYPFTHQLPPPSRDNICPAHLKSCFRDQMKEKQASAF